MRILTIFGTRPEIIKCLPVLLELKNQPGIESIVGVTGQHREMLRQMLDLMDIVPDFDLDVMKPNQTLAGLTATVLTQMPDYLAHYKPDRVLVQGDTTTAFATALAAFYAGIPVGHIEAGLRSHNLYAPWPEEFNRMTIGTLADMHFAPTPVAADNLRREQVPDDRIHITGNTVVDALKLFSARLNVDESLKAEMESRFAAIDAGRRMLLVTSHRRENFDGGIASMCEALKALAVRGDLEIVFPVHLNPNVKGVVETMLSDHSNIHLLPPQDYLSFLYLMNRAHIILSDSGGVQEEAPSLRKPVLVMRETTERPEGVTAGAVKLVGTHRETIINEVTRLMEDEAAYESMRQAGELYGDGRAAGRIVAAITESVTQA